MRLLLILFLTLSPVLAKGGYYHPRARYVPPPKPAPAPTPQTQPAEPPPYVPPVYVTTTNAPAKKTNTVRYVRIEHVSKTGSTNTPPAGPISMSVSVDASDPILQSQKEQAAKGFSEAQYAMGIRYLTGNGVERDESQGKELLKAAADQGSTRAREKLRELKQ